MMSNNVAPAAASNISHALAHTELEEKGLVYNSPDDEPASDIGWQRQPDDIDEPIVGGISNDDLWMLIRRFNKQVFQVQATETVPRDNLDFNSVDDEKLSPDKLRSTMERFYITVIVGVIVLWKHIARLRSWREKRRTAAFCSVYFAAWLYDIIVPTALLLLVVLILFPQSRTTLFPPAPIALVSSESGGIQKPRAGVLGSQDSVTGAPERYRGEAVEQEASNLVDSVASVAVGTIVPDAPMENTISDATDTISQFGDSRASASGKIPSTKHDKTKKPMIDAVWEKVKPFMHILGEITDTYECFGNALSPTPPFSKDAAHLRLAGVLAPMVLVSLLTTPYFAVKFGGFIFGFIFFGDPVIVSGTKHLNHRFPHWQKSLNLRNSLLKGVPTDAQLTITLLRLGEVNDSPIPPPPATLEEPPSKPAPIVLQDVPLDASGADIENAVKPDPAIINQVTEPQLHAGDRNEKPANKKGGLIPTMIKMFKGTTATGVETKLAANYAMAGLGRRHAKDHLGILHKKGLTPSPRGPVEFQCRYKGKKGTAVIDCSSDEGAVLFFTSEPSSLGPGPPTIANAKKVLFSIPVNDIRHMKKIGGMGWKGKLIVGWAEAEKEVIDGLQIIGKDPKQDFRITAMKTRNQLFNRLAAMGDQVWAFC